VAQTVKLQPLTKVTAEGAQDITEAVEAGSFSNATVILNVTDTDGFMGSTMAQFEVETAAENSEEKYGSMPTKLDFSVTGATTLCGHSYQFARFLRWNLTQLTGTGKSITFEVDVVLKSPA